MERVICDKQKCSGCGACSIICPKQCITMEKTDFLGTIRPRVDMDRCIECGLCEKTCHVLANDRGEIRLSYPSLCYAVRSFDWETKSNGASGGIASEMYKYAIANGIFSAGTYFERNKGVYFKELQDLEDIKWARGSKYVFSDLNGIFNKYLSKLKSDEECLFIGLPCQVAALLKLCHTKGVDTSKLVTVDIICHGVPSFKLLDEHLTFIEKKKHRRINKVSFRGPNSLFFFSCYSDGEKIWKRGMHENDTYYRGFSINLFFRDSCYACPYARGERVSDITIGDYSGLGWVYGFEGDGAQMSVLFCNTSKGIGFFDSLCEKQKIENYIRKCDEPMNAEGNPQLRHPSEKPKEYERFMRKYKETKDFERAAHYSMDKLFLGYYLKIPLILLRKGIDAVLPKTVKKYVKSVVGIEKICKIKDKLQ